MRLSKFLLIFLFCLSETAIAQQESARFEVSVVDVNVHGLVVQLGALTNRNVAIGGFADQRLTLNASFTSFAEMLGSVSNKLGGNLVDHPVAPVLTNVCIGEMNPPVSSLKKTPFTLFFGRIDPVQIFNLVYFLNSGDKDYRDRLSPASFGLVGMRLKDVDLPSILEILTMSSGVEVTETAGGLLQARSKASCNFLKNESYDVPFSVRPETCSRNIEPGPDAKRSKCEPLEHFRIENIVLRGYVKNNDATVAIAETPDGITWQIRRGDYLGKDYGKVTDVTTSGVTVREVLKNPYGYIYEQTVFIDYQNIRRPILKK